MNIVLPSAGFGKRFSDHGYKDPKPFVKVKGKYIIEYALSSFKVEGNYYVITSQLEQKYLDILESIYIQYKIKGRTINLDHPTKGATETCLAVEGIIDPDEPLIIMMNDQYSPWNHEAFLEFLRTHDYDAVVSTYNHPNVKIGEKSPYSFIKVDKNNIATEFAEKTAISEHALNGVHYWKSARLFFDSAKKLMESYIETNGEKYLSLTFRFLIEKHYKVSYYKMKDEEFISLGSPSEIQRNIEKLP